MRMRVLSTHEALKGAWAIAQNAWIKEMAAKKIKDWDIKALPGEGTLVEEGLIKLFSEEPITVADRLLNDFPAFLDTYIKKEMQKREPKSLEVQFYELPIS